MEWLSDIFTMQFAAALASIIVIDLVLAGDNAILIALAARNLPPELQKKARSAKELSTSFCASAVEGMV